MAQVNFTDEFTTVIALLEKPSRDGRILRADGQWTALLPAPVLHRSTGTLIGRMDDMWTSAKGELRVAGRALESIARVLNDKTFRLAMDMDEVETSKDGLPGIVFVHGRLRAAHLVKAEDWLWA